MLVAAFAPLSALPAGAQQSVNLTIEKAGEALSQTEDALDASRRAKAKLDAEVAESKQEMLRVRRELVDAAAEAQDMEVRVSALEADLEALEGERRDQQAALSRRRDELVRTLGALQRLGRTPPDLLVFTPVSLHEVTRARLLLGAVAGELNTRADRLGEQLRGLTRLGEKIAVQRKLIDREAERLEAQHAHLAMLLARKTRTHAQAEAQHIRAEELVADLAAEAETLQELLDRLVNERERNERLRREAEARSREAAAEAQATAEARARAEPERPSAPSDSRQIADLNVKSEPSGSPIEDEAPAAQVGDAGGEGARSEGSATVLALATVRPPVSAARGAFAMPARGEMVSRFNEATDTGFSTKGIVIETRASAQIVAPYDGRVAFAGPFREYGLLLIIDHGEGYHTLLAGMGRIDVLVDQRVLAGEPVGVMDSVADGEPRLYVELRSNGHPINPLPWLAAETIKVSG
jgi:septal ring factor EnvC (AmiA/AmiB activator)